MKRGFLSFLSLEGRGAIQRIAWVRVNHRYNPFIPLIYPAFCAGIFSPDGEKKLQKSAISFLS